MVMPTASVEVDVGPYELKEGTWDTEKEKFGDRVTEIFTRYASNFKGAVDQKWAYLVYHGAWFSPLKQALDAFIQTTQANVTGTVTASLFHGTIDLESRQSDHTLFFPEIRGLQSRSFNQQLCGPAAQIGGLPWEVLAKRMSKVSH